MKQSYYPRSLKDKLPIGKKYKHEIIQDVIDKDPNYMIYIIKECNFTLDPNATEYLSQKLGYEAPSNLTEESWKVNIKDRSKENLVYYSDDKRHLVCKPYSVKNLHKMAEELGIKRGWFHKDHYDIPKGMIEEMKSKSIVVSSKEILNIIGR